MLALQDAINPVRTSANIQCDRSCPLILANSFQLAVCFQGFHAASCLKITMERFLVVFTLISRHNWMQCVVHLAHVSDYHACLLGLFGIYIRHPLSC